MAILYVANATKHNQIIVYRLPESTAPIRRNMTPGEQIAIKDLSTADVEAIIRQNVVYGWMDAGAIDHAKPFVGIIYSTDKQITANKIMATMEHNLDVLTARGRDNRKLAAVATNDTLQRAFDASNVADLQSMSMSIEEQGTKTHDAEISEHFTVDRHAEAPETVSSRPQSRKQAKSRK